MRSRTVVAGAVAALVGCQETPEPPKIPLSEIAQARAATPTAIQNVAGTVLEQLQAPPYTYLRLKAPSGEIWVAVPAGTFKSGDRVTVADAMLMQKFESKALGRTFDEVYFGTLAGPDGARGPAAAGTMGGGVVPQGAGTPPAARANVGKVAKAAGPDARTIGEVWAQKASLAGRTVTIRGVVVKYNADVMGKNWIHLQDGSGDAKAGTHDIAVTTLDAATMGATITVRGTVRVNRDFGAGYVYPVIVEDATIAKRL